MNETDETIAKWIIEFLLRKTIDDKVINGVLSSLPLSDTDYRLKKSILLRRIESETASGSVSENVLQLMETIEELDHKEGKTASDLLKEAYCLTAVDCTVRFLEENVEENGKYFEAVERVWRNRVCKVEGLVSEVSNRWLDDIEAAVWDSGVCARIFRSNTRYEALKAVRAFLKEEWQCMGPTFLELVAAKAGNEGKGLSHGGTGGGGMACEVNPCRVLIPLEGTRKVQASVRRKHVATKNRRQRGAKISVTDDDATNNASDIPSETERGQDATANVARVQEAVRPSPMEMHGAEDRLSDDLQTAQASSSAVPTDNHMNMEDQTGPQSLATPEVNRVQEALRFSSEELRTAVNDPLPEALRTAQPLSVATSNIGTTVENQTGSEVHAVPEVRRVRGQRMTQKVAPNNTRSAPHTEPEIRAPDVPTEKDPGNVEKNDSLKDDAGEQLPPDPRKQENPRKRSLMEPNGTSHTFEWDDSIDNSCPGSPSQPRLPTPKLRRTSPLKKLEDRTFQRRRERKKWTPQEEDTLRTGVLKFGKGNWKLILNCYHGIFQERTDVDLKDKWRNMMKYPS